MHIIHSMTITMQCLHFSIPIIFIPTVFTISTVVPVLSTRQETAVLAISAHTYHILIIIPYIELFIGTLLYFLYVLLYPLCLHLYLHFTLSYLRYIYVIE